MQDALLQHDFLSFVQAFVTLFAIFDPIGSLPIFSALTGNLPAKAKNRIIKTSCLTALGILVIFAYLGNELFRLLGITLNDFKIMAGLILLIFAIRYVLGRDPSDTISASGEDIAVFPLATPLLAGPGSISVVVLMLNPPYGPVTTLVVILLNVFIAYLVLHLGIRLYGLLGRQGTTVISRIMGLLVGAVALRFMREGLADLLKVLF